MSTLLSQFADAGVKLKAIHGGQLRAQGPLTDALRAAIRQHKPEILAELEAANEAADSDVERRRVRVLNLLAQNPNWRRAVVTDSCGDQVIVTIAVRGVAVGELSIDRGAFDGLTLLRRLEQRDSDPASLH